MTSLTITKVEITESTAENERPKLRQLPENATLTKPLPDHDVRRAISDVVTRADVGYALDLITMVQLKARLAADTGERLTLDEFADALGWPDELAQLRSE